MRRGAPGFAYVDPSRYTDGPQTPMVIVLHDTESDGKGADYLRTIGNFLEGEKLSVHFCVAADGAIGNYAHPREKCRHAPPNTGKVGIEQGGYAAWKRLKWLGRGKQLHSTAKLIAWLSRDYGIPIHFSVEHGVCEHRNLPEGGHHDCGPGYPFNTVLLIARLYRKSIYR